MARAEEDRPKERGVSAIILAAGLSSRFGRAKQLADLDGVALVRRAQTTLELSLVDEIVVVVGHRAGLVAEELRGTSARVVVNEDYRSGLGTSLRSGVAALGTESRAVVVCLADQPFVTAQLIDRIVTRHRRTGSDIVASASRGLISPPVLFSRRLYGELAELRGDKGARSIIERHSSYEKVRVRPEILLDVDTEEDLRRANGLLGGGAVRARRARGADGRGRTRPSSGS